MDIDKLFRYIDRLPGERAQRWAVDFAADLEAGRDGRDQVGKSGMNADQERAARMNIRCLVRS